MSHGTARRPDERKAWEWAERIVSVLSGRLKATEAARQLGVSRKSYYKRQNRVLEAILAALTDRKAGRPAGERDEENEALKRRVRELEAQLLRMEQRWRVRKIAGADSPAGGGKKSTG